MLEFYRENVKYYLKLAWYRYMVYLALTLPFLAVLAVVMFLLRGSQNTEIFNILAISIIISPVLIGLLLGIALAFKVMLLTFYSLQIDQHESFKVAQIVYGLYKTFTNIKVLLSLILSAAAGIAVGYVVYTQVYLKSFDPFKITITIILLCFLALVFLTRDFFLKIFAKVWDLLWIIGGKIPAVAGVILLAVAVVGGLYAVVSFIIDSL